PDVFLHLRKDAASVLWQRTGGLPDLVALEARAWVQAGLCTWEGARLRIDRIDIEALRVGLALAVDQPIPETLTDPARLLLEAARRAWPDTDPGLLGDLCGLDARALKQATGQLLGARLAWPLPDGSLGIRPVVLPASDSVEREAQLRVARLLPEDSPSRLRHLVAGGASPDDVLPVALRVVDNLLREGRHSQALALLDLTLPLTRGGVGRPHDEEALLCAWVRAALAQERPEALERALYELGRAVSRTPLVERVEALVYAERVRFRGEPERCQTLVDALPSFLDPRLDLYRVALTYAAASLRSLDAAKQVLDGLDAWGNRSALFRSKLDKWRGNLAYAMGDYAGAAALHVQSADLAPGSDARASSLSNAAFALLDGGRLEDALETARRGAHLARRIRYSLAEARCRCVERQVRYRWRQTLSPDPELIAAAERISVRLAAQFCAVEVGFALRGGQRDLALEMAEVGARGFRIAGFEPGCLLLEAAALVATPSPSPADARRICAAATALSDPSFSVQIIGLVRVAMGMDRFAQADVQAQADRVGTDDPDAIIDVISVNEALRGCFDPWTKTD
ncbi:MAG: hypothetical protein GXP62_19390, partial [Oligoflexia bacterium]|nr:hypothetical protein [Oligoflexia bacterium]